MALLSFLGNNRNDLTAYFFDHGTKTSRDAMAFVSDYCEKKSIALKVGVLQIEKPSRDSWEEFWRTQRYAWLHSQNDLIATGHHLNDLAETYIWGTAHGHPRYIHYQQPVKGGLSNIIRPMLLTPKKELYSWCERHAVPFIEDASNEDTRFTRNRIRRNILPEMLKVNPGFLKVVERSWKDYMKTVHYS